MKKVFFINCLIILVLLFLIEMSIRVFSDITPQGMSRGIIDDKSTKPKFNYSNISKAKLFGKKVYTDKNGFRIDSKSNNLYFNKKNNIYFVGGSVTFGSGVDQSKTFSGVLNKEFKNLNILNSSVVGSNLENNFYIIKNKISKKNLNKIFINFSLDDIEIYEKDNKSSINQEKRERESFLSKLQKKIKKNKFFFKINNFIRSKSVTYVFIKAKFLNSEKNYYYHAINSFKVKKNLNYLKDNLNLISLENKKLKNKIVFLIIPYSYQIKGNNCANKDMAENLIEDHLNKMNFKTLKIKKIFCNDKRKDKIFLTYDPAHLSEYGHSLVANFLKEKI